MATVRLGVKGGSGSGGRFRTSRRGILIMAVSQSKVGLPWGSYYRVSAAPLLQGQIRRFSN
jgi:hypothetical protein